MKQFCFCFVTFTGALFFLFYETTILTDPKLQQYVSFKELHLRDRYLDESNNKNESLTQFRSFELKICEAHHISYIFDNITTLGEQWFDRSEDRSTGRWFYGSKYRRKTRERAIYGNLGCNEEGNSHSCSSQLGDEFVRLWRQQAGVDLGCANSIFCQKQPYSKQIVCSLSNVKIHFNLMKSEKVCLEPESRCVRREISLGFLQVSCPIYDPLKESAIPLGLNLNETISGSGRCNTVMAGTVILFSAHEIENLGHTIEDFMNVWLMLQVSQSTRGAQDNVSILVIDQLFPGAGRYTKDQSPFYRFLEKIFQGNVIYAAEQYDETLCVDKVITYSSARDRFPFVFRGLEFNMECSFKGPSSLYQRWNLFARQAYGTLTNISQSKNRTNILLLLRGKSSQQIHMQANRELNPHSRDNLVKALRNLGESVHVTVADLGLFSFEEQMMMVAQNHLIIGMHGAAISMALHMSIGTPHCCGVIEIYNSRTKFGSYYFHGNALRSTGIYYTRVNSLPYTASEKISQSLYTDLKCPRINESARHRNSSISVAHSMRRVLKTNTPALLKPVDIDVAKVMSEVDHTISVLNGMQHTKKIAKSGKHFPYEETGSCVLPHILYDEEILQ